LATKRDEDVTLITSWWSFVKLFDCSLPQKEKFAALKKISA